jgi:hypothetical protein
VTWTRRSQIFQTTFDWVTLAGRSDTTSTSPQTLIAASLDPWCHAHHAGLGSVDVFRLKFDVDLTDKEFIKKVAMEYTEGLVWVLRYYYQV